MGDREKNRLVLGGEIADMSTLIPMLDDGSQRWLATMVAVLLQSALLAAAAFLIVRALRRSSPAVRYWLWQIVAVKLLLMPFWTFALPLPSWATGWPTSRPAAISPVGGRVGDASAATSELDGATAGVNQKAVSPPATPENPPTPISWPSWLLMVWSAVGLSLLVRLMFQRMRLARLLRRGVPVSRDIAELVAELAGRMGLRRARRLCRSPTTVRCSSVDFAGRGSSCRGDCWPRFPCPSGGRRFCTSWPISSVGI